MSELEKCKVRPVHGEPLFTAMLRESAEDFVVDEILDLAPDITGSRAHLWLQVEKRELNTTDVVADVARLFACPARDVGYSGLKDRRALTRQWFSVPTELAADWVAELGEGDAVSVLERVNTACVDARWRVLNAEWRSRKLRRGTHSGNRFSITLREVAPLSDPATLEARVAARVELLRAEGFPNAFGPQRFGAAARNVSSVRRLFARAGSPQRPRGQRQKQERGMLLSAARSLVFNQVLDARVADGSWNQALEGEPLLLSGSNSRFVPDSVDDDIVRRLQQKDISPSGPLPGQGDGGAIGECLALEEVVLERESALVAGLVAARVDADRRALRAEARELTCEPMVGGDGTGADDTWQLEVVLDTGVFATSLLNELGECRDVGVGLSSR